jgi:hypothetical protein
MVHHGEKERTIPNDRSGGQGGGTVPKAPLLGDLERDLAASPSANLLEVRADALRLVTQDDDKSADPHLQEPADTAFGKRETGQAYQRFRNLGAAAPQPSSFACCQDHRHRRFVFNR